MSAPAVLRRLAGFSGLQLVSAIAPLALLPVLARAAGVSGWASIAAGQSIGTLVAAVSMFGWGVVGPARVAAASDDGTRWHLYRSGLASRLALLVVTLPLGCAVSLLVAADGYVVLTVVMVCAQSCGALSPAWYAIGVGKPRLILLYDAGPRLVGVLVAAVALSQDASLLVYPLLVLVSSLAGTIAITARLRADSPRQEAYRLRNAWADCRTTLRRNAAAAGTQIAETSYGSSVLAIVGIVATTAATAELASGDKLYRFGLMAVVAVGNTFQGWVAEVPYPESRRRMKASLASLVGLGLIGAVCLALLGNWATGFLFGADLAASSATVAFYALAFLCICTSTSLGRHILVPLGLPRYLLAATVCGAIVGIPAMAALSHRYGAVGGAAGYAASELVMTLVLAVLLLRVSRGRTPRTTELASA